MAKETKEYSKEGTYEKRDIIFHPQFQDKGKIVKIDLQGQLQILTVDFEKSGTRKLIAGDK